MQSANVNQQVSNNTDPVKMEPRPTQNNQQPFQPNVTDLQQKDSNISNAVKMEPGQAANPQHPSDPNMGSILIPDENDIIQTLSCSFCGYGIEMTEDLLTEFIASQQKNVIALLRVRVQAHFAEMRSRQTSAGVQCQLIGQPIQWDEPTE